jgi:citrate synthase
VRTEPASEGTVPETVTITDNRTGESVDIPIENGGVDGSAFAKLLPGVWFFDPSFGATASTSSAITELDGEQGILRYRGYPIEQLAAHSTYLEVAYLLLFGELPDKEQLEKWVHDVTFHTFTHENMRKRFMEGFHHDAHPMGVFCSAMAALSTFYPEAKDIDDPENRYRQINRLISKVPTIAAMAYRASVGMPFVYPDNNLSYTENFLSMMWRVAEPHYEPDPVLSRALEVLFILHADHEQNCSTTAMRVTGSSHADPYSCAASATAALYGPRHGGANEAVIRMLREIESIDNVGAFIESVKAGSGRLMGFGHRVYKAYDPRARIVKETADAVFEVTGKNPLLDIALKLEDAALSDEYFKSRNLYPNVDFYTGLIYQAMGFPMDMFTVLFAIPRMSGWLAHWQELLEQGQRIARPRQLYVGPTARDYVPLDQR